VAYTGTGGRSARPIIEFQASYHTLVESGMAIDAHRMLTYRAAAGAATAAFRTPGSSMAKLSGCIMLPEVTLKAMILCGGDGTTLAHATQRLAPRLDGRLGSPAARHGTEDASPRSCSRTPLRAMTEQAMTEHPMTVDQAFVDRCRAFLDRHAEPRIPGERLGRGPDTVPIFESPDDDQERRSSGRPGLAGRTVRRRPGLIGRPDEYGGAGLTAAIRTPSTSSPRVPAAEPLHRVRRAENHRAGHPGGASEDLKRDLLRGSTGRT